VNFQYKSIFTKQNRSLIFVEGKSFVMNHRPENTHTYNGIVLGALFVLISLVWFTVPLVFFEQVIIYPAVMFLVGIITVIRYSNK